MNFLLNNNATGTRKFYLCIFYGILYTIVLMTIIIVCKPAITSYEIIAIASGYVALIGMIIYGYKQEYRFNNKVKGD